jgi:NAD(P)-dependent dehydrogenase (short-subunit alcohol dehydrogenase family)
MSAPFDLTGQVALVTGASSGIGRRIAMVLAEHGAAVAIAARGEDRLETLAAEIAARGGRAFPLGLDVADIAAFAPAVDRVEAALGGIDLLVNNAGIAPRQRAVKASAEVYDAVMTVNLRGPYFLATEVGRRMIERGAGGRIINIASSSGLKAMPGFSAYGTSKAALIHLTRALAAEWAQDQINVNAICPGYILSEMTGELAASDAGRRLQETLPRQRMGAPEDLDCMILALASPANRFTTGAVIAVDDGIAA